MRTGDTADTGLPMRLRKQTAHTPEATDDLGAPAPQAEATNHTEIADGALTRERQFVEGAQPLRETDDSAPAKPDRRRDVWSLRGRSENADGHGVTPEVLSRLSKYGMTSDVQARQKKRLEEDEDEPWRKP
jgi:hypothetical protein